MCAATCVFEGSLDEVNNEERRLYALAEEYSGVMELDPANIFANANLVDIIGSPHSKL
ncbi:hypothetical protein KIN20_012459 [Parelaphostrongylus tenuis]|uniref:Uncharacterized protein n=1 Tax=Parelaphostrongylus tenuis TaxID=148309 RepID=A0AAD5MAQ3_PARTN|nr:hypothetical protein KIN20_012459 [Parelaphostrongylus tenuis]